MKIYDSQHQAYTIRNWIKYGLKCREGETYKDIYYHVMSIDKCELCNIEFTDEIKNQRCMDHDHNTGYFRKVLCRGCNANYLTASQKLKRSNKLGHMFISRNITKNRSGTYCVGFRYERKGFKRKGSQSLTKLIALSFIHILKKPI
tara:strand:- start:308 stop:745 length:438 start_codon:yes stop_codon:yes gene_type:complete